LCINKHCFRDSKSVSSVILSLDSFCLPRQIIPVQSWKWYWLAVVLVSLSLAYLLVLISCFLFMCLEIQNFRSKATNGKREAIHRLARNKILNVFVSQTVRMWWQFYWSCSGACRRTAEVCFFDNDNPRDQKAKKTFSPRAECPFARLGE